MTGQLAVPLHHVEGVGDIAVLPPCATCGGKGRFPGVSTPAGTTWFECDRCPPAPVVGQVVAHVEKCTRCLPDAPGYELTGGNEKKLPDGRWVRSCDKCAPAGAVATSGSGWVRDQYVRVIEVLPIVAIRHACSRPRHIAVAADRTLLCFGTGGGQPVGLPGAVPGGVALIVEPAETVCEATGQSWPDDGICPACGERVHDYDRNLTIGAHLPRPELAPVLAPSAPYTESEEA